MNLRHFTTGTVLLGVLALLCSVWWSESESDLQVLPTTTTGIPKSEPLPTQPVRLPTNRHDVDCLTCPSAMSSVDDLKRSGPETQPVSELALSDDGCRGLLLAAAREGNPNPDTSEFGGCGGMTPLHYASTPEQIRNLLESGADVNAVDRYGHSALHMRAVMNSRVENPLLIIDLLLEAGADARLENNRGEMPWKLSRHHSSTTRRHLALNQVITSNARNQGQTVDDYLALNPRYQDRLDDLMRGYLMEGMIQKRLLRAAVSQLGSPLASQLVPRENP